MASLPASSDWDLVSAGPVRSDRPLGVSTSGPCSSWSTATASLVRLGAWLRSDWPTQGLWYSRGCVPSGCDPLKALARAAEPGVSCEACSKLCWKASDETCGQQSRLSVFAVQAQCVCGELQHWTARYTDPRWREALPWPAIP